MSQERARISFFNPSNFNLTDLEINELDFYGLHHLHVKGGVHRSNIYHKKVSYSKDESHTYFCDWCPVLFGIDEDEIPSSDDEEGVFDMDWSDLELQAVDLTEADLKAFRIGDRKCLSDAELREAWLRQQRPMYGRRARIKQTPLGDNNLPFDCICDVDLHYSRHHIPHFGGGVAKEGEELHVPHFKAFWEDFKERGEIGGVADLGRVSEIFKTETEEKEVGTFQRPVLKFKDSTKGSIRKMRSNLLSTFRPLHCREVRRYRMPYSEAMYLEMQEDGYVNGAAFFKHLIIKDHFVHLAPDTLDRPKLRDNRLILNKIFEILKMGERNSRKEAYHTEAYLYLKTGKHFNDLDMNWWWIAEEFYMKAVKVSQNCVIDGGKAEAISNYILGTFLLDCVSRVQPAQEHLLRARELSMGKDWSAKNILNNKQDTVHKECATHLCRALIAASKELRKNGKPEEALPLIHRSYKLCEELGSDKSEIDMETYFELGMTYQAVGMLDWAKVAFRKFIGLAEMKNFVKGVCDGYLEMAICYRSEGDLDKCQRNISIYLALAKANENVNLTAFGNRYLGEFFLNSGRSEEAVHLFDAAFKSFLEQCNECSNIPFNEWQQHHFTLPNDVELTRVLYGLAQGEILTKAICSLVHEAKEETNKMPLLHLIHWKNSADKYQLKTAIKEVQDSRVKSSNYDIQEPDKPTEAEEEENRTVHFASAHVLVEDELQPTLRLKNIPIISNEN